MAKKKTHKKQSFKYGEPSRAAEPKAEVATAQVKSAPVAATPVTDHPYLRGDLSRIAVIGLSLVAAELILWYVIGHTNLGQSVYSLYKVGV